MKTKLITTQKAEILVVELPEGATNVMVWSRNEDKTIHDIRYQINHTVKKHLERINIAPGDWQPLTFDEETAEKIVDKVIGNQHYQNYNYMSITDRWVSNALESLKSLIQINVSTFNNYFDYPTAYNSWEEAEESTFHNPHYFFKLI